MDGKNIAIIGLVIAVLVLGSLLLLRPTARVEPFGASSVSTNKAWFADGLYLGGGVKTVTNGGSGNTTTTLTATDICDNFQFNYTATGITTVTLPTGSALQQTCLKNGASHFYKDTIWRNLGVATTTVAFTAGASSTAFTASSTGTSLIGGSRGGIIRFLSVPEGGADKVQIFILENFK